MQLGARRYRMMAGLSLKNISSLHPPSPAPPQAELSSKAKEAELNARVLSLESQIHWLSEQNTQLQAALQTQQQRGAQEAEGGATVGLAEGGAGAEQGAAAVAAAAPQQGGTAAAGGTAGAEQAAAGAGAAGAVDPGLAQRCALLESDLRKAKRAELKLQAMLYRWAGKEGAPSSGCLWVASAPACPVCSPSSETLCARLTQWHSFARRLRKDIEEGGLSGAAFDKLRDVRSLEYEVDMLSQKLKRCVRAAGGIGTGL